MNPLNKRLEIVDISPLASRSNKDYVDAAGKLYSALSEIGFAVIVNHGVDETIISDMRHAVATVFETPREILAQDMVVKGNYRGFVPLGYFTP
ncbi:MAG: 2-oxoglutarate and iron-dependent oxygenase domain-containing protein, partial [Acidimicrobiaceae bacterium]